MVIFDRPVRPFQFHGPFKLTFLLTTPNSNPKIEKRPPNWPKIRDPRRILDSFFPKTIWIYKPGIPGRPSVSIIPPRIDQFSSDHWSQTRTGRVSTYMGDRLGIPCVLSIFSFLYGVYGPHRIHLWHVLTTRWPPSGRKKVCLEVDSNVRERIQGCPRPKIHLNSLERPKLKLYSSHFWVRFRLSNR